MEPSQLLAHGARQVPGDVEAARMRRCLAGLPRGSPAREAAEAVLAGGACPERTVPLLAVLAGDARCPRLAERLAATWALGFRPHDPEEPDPAASVLRAVLADDLPPVPARAWRGFARTIAAAAPVAGTLAVLLATRHAGVFVAVSMALSAAAVTLLLLADSRTVARWFAARDRRLDSLRAVAALSLGRLGARDALGTLAVGAFDAARDVQMASLEALKAVIGRLTAGDYGALPSDTVPALCRLLWHPDHAAALAAVDGLERIGDGRALPFVIRAASSGRDPEVMAAAARILPVIRERARMEKDPGRLLRPSHPPAATPEAMLRPSDFGTAYGGRMVRPADLSVQPAPYGQTILPPEHEAGGASTATEP